MLGIFVCIIYFVIADIVVRVLMEKCEKLEVLHIVLLLSMGFLMCIAVELLLGKVGGL